jgi:putative exporter of polyketide antibiotics
MKNVSAISAVIYTGISIIVAGLFLLGTLAGRYTLVERFGGAAWVFLLCMIILMPIIIPLVKKRLGG